MKKLFVKNQEASPKGYNPPVAVDEQAQSTFDRQTAEALWLSGSAGHPGHGVPQTPPTGSLFAGMALHKEGGSSANGTPAAAAGSTPIMEGQGGGGASAFSFIQQTEVRDDSHEDSMVSSFSFIQDSAIPSSPPPAYGTGAPIDAVSAFSFLQAEASPESQTPSIYDQSQTSGMESKSVRPSPTPRHDDEQLNSSSLSAKQTIEPRALQETAVAPAAAVSSSAAAAPTPVAATTTQGQGIKKKKIAARRPGYAAGIDESLNSSHQPPPQPTQAAPQSSDRHPNNDPQIMQASESRGYESGGGSAATSIYSQTTVASTKLDVPVGSIYAAEAARDIGDVAVESERGRAEASVGRADIDARTLDISAGKEEERKQDLPPSYDSNAGAAPDAYAGASIPQDAPPAVVGKSIYDQQEAEDKEQKHRGEGGGPGSSEDDIAQSLLSSIERLQRRLSQQESVLKREASVLTIEQGKIRRLREETITRLHETKRQITSSQAAQAIAQEREDYEAAEALVSKISALAAEKDSLEASANKLSRDLEALADKKNQLDSLLLEEWSEYSVELEERLSEQKKAFSTRAGDTLARATAEEEALAEAVESVTNQLEHLKFDREKIVQEKASIEDTINSKTKEERAEIQELETKRAQVNEEIEQILEKLRLKREEEAMLSQRLLAAQDKVQDVRNGFTSKISRLQEKETNIQHEEEECSSRLSEMNSKQEELRLQRQDIMKKHEAVEVTMEKVAKTLEGAKKRCKEMQVEKQRVDQDSAHRRSLIADAEESNGRILEIRNLLLQKENRKTDIAGQVLTLQQQASMCRSELAGIDARVPELEEHKKLAVAAKNFKEAGRLANDLKLLVSQREETWSSQNSINEKLQRLHKELADHEEEIAKWKSGLEEEERKATVLRFKHLRWWSTSLKRSGDQAYARGDLESAREWGEQLSMCDMEISELRARLPAELVEEKEKELEPTVSSEEGNLMEGAEEEEEAVGGDCEGEPRLETNDEETTAEEVGEQNRDELAVEDRDVSAEESEEDANERADDQAGESSQREEEINAMLLRKDEIEAEIQQLESALQELVVEERYDEAAEIQQSIDELSEELEQIKLQVPLEEAAQNEAVEQQKGCVEDQTSEEAEGRRADSEQAVVAVASSAEETSSSMLEHGEELNEDVPIGQPIQEDEGNSDADAPASAFAFVSTT